MTNYNSGGILTDFGSLVKSTYILKILHDKAPLIFQYFVCKQKVKCKISNLKEQTRGYVYAALNDHCFGPISSAFASKNKNSCKFGNKLICQLI